jgi:hypothetical protein
VSIRVQTLSGVIRVQSCVVQFVIPFRQHGDMHMYHHTFAISHLLALFPIPEKQKRKKKKRKEKKRRRTYMYRFPF